MQKKENKKQHFIPQCYLRYFSKNKKYLYVYNKAISKSYLQSISNTAYEDNFYRIPEKFMSDEVFCQNFFEKEFFDKKKETKLGSILKITSDKSDIFKSTGNKNYVLSKSDKEIFAALIAIQYLRMPNISNKYWNAQKDIESKRLEILKAFYASQNVLEKSYMEKICLQFNEEDKAANHSTIYSDKYLIDNMQDHIINKIWAFYICKEDSFYTSDNPILLKPNIERVPFLFEGFATEGIEIIYPISSPILLVLLDKVYFSDKINQDNVFNHIDEKSKREYNCYQYIWCNRDVYSRYDNFGLIDLLKRANEGKEIFKKNPVFRYLE